MKIIVTGVAGFIGSTLAEKLASQGHDVVGVDCFTNYYSRKIKENNLKNLMKAQNFSFINKDLLHLDLPDLLSSADVVFHEAAQAGVRKSWGVDFDLYVRNNISVTQALLEAAKECSLSHFVYASSSSVYGDAESFPTKETCLPRPVSPYGVTKLACEHLCGAYIKNFKLPITMLRYFTVYGPRQRPDMAFHKFIKAALEGKTISVYGDGKQTRDFTYVSDIVDANLLVLEKNIREGIFNIGGGARITLNEAIHTIEDLTCKEIKIAYLSPEKGDAKHTSADIRKAKQMLGYRPKTETKEGLSREIDWIKSNIDILL